MEEGMDIGPEPIENLGPAVQRYRDWLARRDGFAIDAGLLRG
jgi:hypothetical protein